MTSNANGKVLVPTITSFVFTFVVFSAGMVALGILDYHVLAHGTIGAWDRHVSTWFARRRSGGWNTLSGDATDIADTFSVIIVAVIVTAVLLVRHWGRYACLLLAGLATEICVFLVTNYTVRQPRPTVPHVGGTPSTFSFPSGHTAATIVLYGGIALLVTVSNVRRIYPIIAWVLASALTICVGMSRIYRGEHYPTDVFAGAVLGVISLCAGVFLIRVLESASPAKHVPFSHATPSSTSLDSTNQ
jgi:membrane-associated phospholipid phosphatase